MPTQTLRRCLSCILYFLICISPSRSQDPSQSMSHSTVLVPAYYKASVETGNVVNNAPIVACFAGYDDEIYKLMDDVIEKANGDDVLVYFFMITSNKLSLLGTAKTTLASLQSIVLNYHHYYCLNKRYLDNCNQNDWLYGKLIMLPKYGNTNNFYNGRNGPATGNTENDCSVNHDDGDEREVIRNQVSTYKDHLKQLFKPYHEVTGCHEYLPRIHESILPEIKEEIDQLRLENQREIDMLKVNVRNGFRPVNINKKAEAKENNDHDVLNDVETGRDVPKSDKNTGNSNIPDCPNIKMGNYIPQLPSIIIGKPFFPFLNIKERYSADKNIKVPSQPSINIKSEEVPDLSIRNRLTPYMRDINLKGIYPEPPDINIGRRFISLSDINAPADLNVGKSSMPCRINVKGIYPAPPNINIPRGKMQCSDYSLPQRMMTRFQQISSPNFKINRIPVNNRVSNNPVNYSRNTNPRASTPLNIRVTIGNKSFPQPLDNINCKYPNISKTKDSSTARSLYDQYWHILRYDPGNFYKYYKPTVNRFSTTSNMASNYPERFTQCIFPSRNSGIPLVNCAPYYWQPTSYKCWYHGPWNAYYNQRNIGPNNKENFMLPNAQNGNINLDYCNPYYRSQIYQFQPYCGYGSNVATGPNAFLNYDPKCWLQYRTRNPYGSNQNYRNQNNNNYGNQNYVNQNYGNLNYGNYQGSIDKQAWSKAHKDPWTLPSPSWVTGANAYLNPFMAYVCSDMNTQNYMSEIPPVYETYAPNAYKTFNRYNIWKTKPYKPIITYYEKPKVVTIIQNIQNDNNKPYIFDLTKHENTNTKQDNLPIVAKDVQENSGFSQVYNADASYYPINLKSSENAPTVSNYRSNYQYSNMRLQSQNPSKSIHSTVPDENRLKNTPYCYQIPPQYPFYPNAQQNIPYAFNLYYNNQNYLGQPRFWWQSSKPSAISYNPSSIYSTGQPSVINMNNNNLHYLNPMHAQYFQQPNSVTLSFDNQRTLQFQPQYLNYQQSYSIKPLFNHQIFNIPLPVKGNIFYGNHNFKKIPMRNYNLEYQQPKANVDVNNQSILKPVQALFRHSQPSANVYYGDKKSMPMHIQIQNRPDQLKVRFPQPAKAEILQQVSIPAKIIYGNQEVSSSISPQQPKPISLYYNNQGSKPAQYRNHQPSFVNLEHGNRGTLRQSPPQALYLRVPQPCANHNLHSGKGSEEIVNTVPMAANILLQTKPNNVYSGNGNQGFKNTIPILANRQSQPQVNNNYQRNGVFSTYQPNVWCSGIRFNTPNIRQKPLPLRASLTINTDKYNPSSSLNNLGQSNLSPQSMAPQKPFELNYQLKYNYNPKQPSTRTDYISLPGQPCDNQPSKYYDISWRNPKSPSLASQPMLNENCNLFQLKDQPKAYTSVNRQPMTSICVRLPQQPNTYLNQSPQCIQLKGQNLPETTFNEFQTNQQTNTQTSTHQSPCNPFLIPRQPNFTTTPSLTLSYQQPSVWQPKLRQPGLNVEIISSSQPYTQRSQQLIFPPYNIKYNENQPSSLKTENIQTSTIAQNSIIDQLPPDNNYQNQRTPTLATFDAPIRTQNNPITSDLKLSQLPISIQHNVDYITIPHSKVSTNQIDKPCTFAADNQFAQIGENYINNQYLKAPANKNPSFNIVPKTVNISGAYYFNIPHSNTNTLKPNIASYEGITSTNNQPIEIIIQPQQNLLAKQKYHNLPATATLNTEATRPQNQIPPELSNEGIQYQMPLVDQNVPQYEIEQTNTQPKYFEIRSQNNLKSKPTLQYEVSPSFKPEVISTEALSKAKPALFEAFSSTKSTQPYLEALNNINIQNLNYQNPIVSRWVQNMPSVHDILNPTSQADYLNINTLKNNEYPNMPTSKTKDDTFSPTNNELPPQTPCNSIEYYNILRNGPTYFPPPKPYNSAAHDNKNIIRNNPTYSSSNFKPAHYATDYIALPETSTKLNPNPFIFDIPQDQINNKPNNVNKVDITKPKLYNFKPSYNQGNIFESKQPISYTIPICNESSGKVPTSYNVLPCNTDQFSYNNDIKPQFSNALKPSEPYSIDNYEEVPLSTENRVNSKETVNLNNNNQKTEHPVCEFETQTAYYTATSKMPESTMYRATNIVEYPNTLTYTSSSNPKRQKPIALSQSVYEVPVNVNPTCINMPNTQNQQNREPYIQIDSTKSQIGLRKTTYPIENKRVNTMNTDVNSQPGYVTYNQANSQMSLPSERDMPTNKLQIDYIKTPGYEKVTQHDKTDNPPKHNSALPCRNTVSETTNVNDEPDNNVTSNPDYYTVPNKNTNQLTSEKSDSSTYSINPTTLQRLPISYPKPLNNYESANYQLNAANRFSNPIQSREPCNSSPEAPIDYNTNRNEPCLTTQLYNLMVSTEPTYIPLPYTDNTNVKNTPINSYNIVKTQTNPQGKDLIDNNIDDSRKPNINMIDLKPMNDNNNDFAHTVMPVSYSDKSAKDTSNFGSIKNYNPSLQQMKYTQTPKDTGFITYTGTESNIKPEPNTVSNDNKPLALTPIPNINNVTPQISYTNVSATKSPVGGYATVSKQIINNDNNQLPIVSYTSPSVTTLTRNNINNNPTISVKNLLASENSRSTEYPTTQVNNKGQVIKYTETPLTIRPIDIDAPVLNLPIELTNGPPVDTTMGNTKAPLDNKPNVQSCMPITLPSQNIQSNDKEGNVKLEDIKRGQPVTNYYDISQKHETTTEPLHFKNSHTHKTPDTTTNKLLNSNNEVTKPNFESSKATYYSPSIGTSLTAEASPQPGHISYYTTTISSAYKFSKVTPFSIPTEENPTTLSSFYKYSTIEPFNVPTEDNPVKIVSEPHTQNLLEQSTNDAISNPTMEPDKLSDIKNSLCKYLKTNACAKDFDTNGQCVKIPLGDFGIKRNNADKNNCSVYKTEDKNIYIKMWKTDLNMFKAKLILERIPLKKVTNFVPVVTDKNADLNKAQNIAEDFIRENFGEPIVVKGENSFYKSYAIVCPDSKADGLNILWPTETGAPQGGTICGIK